MSDASWFAIVDAAQDPRLEGLIGECGERLCLFKGDTARDLGAVSPWLVRINNAEPLLPRWQEHGKGANWGIMLQSSLAIEYLQRHFRKFLQAKLPDGTLALFRFYDPRVFNTFIRHAEPADRAKLFDGIDQYAVEREDGQGLHQYVLRGGQLLDGNTPIG